MKSVLSTRAFQTAGFAAILALIFGCERLATSPELANKPRHPTGIAFLLVDPDCTDDTCDDQYDYWGDDGGDTWDSFPSDDSESTVDADYHDDLAACIPSDNCTLRAPSDSEKTLINDAAYQLDHDTSTFCQQLGSILDAMKADSTIKFYDQHITRGTQTLGGDAHPCGNAGDPYTCQIHVYGNGRSPADKMHTLVHEAAHFAGNHDGDPVGTTNPFLMTADQAASYCGY